MLQIIDMLWAHKIHQHGTINILTDKEVQAAMIANELCKKEDFK